MLLIKCTQHNRCTQGAGILCLLFVLPMLVIGLIQYAASRRRAPDESQRIAATLVSWGVGIDSLSIPVSQEEVDRHIEMLRSADSEARVQAADWLAARGVREASADIAAAMVDAGTLRPCQLAHSLGYLGDKRWANLLADATKHPSNLDLRVCATTALSKLQSPDTIDALIEVYRNGTAPTTALDALGKISDPAAMYFLRSVVEQPRSDIELTAALRAIERIEMMQEPDVAMALIQRLRSAASKGVVDEWATRKLANLGDTSAVAALGDTLRVVADNDSSVIVAAALLACGDAGIETLRMLADEGERAASTSAIAHAALLLVQQADPTVLARR